MRTNCQKPQRIDNAAAGWVSRVSRTNRKGLRWASGVILTAVVGGIVASCNASEITGPAQAFQQGTLKPLTSAIVTHPAKMEIPLEPFTMPCPPFEPVEVDGKTVLSFHMTFSPTSGNTHVKTETHTTGTATRITSEVELTPDDVWKVDSRFMSEEELAGYIPLPYEQTIETRDRFVGQGKNPNFIRHTIFHITVNANGIPTASVAKTQYHCEDITS